MHEDVIAYYRQMMDKHPVYVREYPQSLSIHNSGMQKLQKQLADGLITLEQFTQDAQSKLRLMQLENQ